MRPSVRDFNRNNDTNAAWNDRNDCFIKLYDATIVLWTSPNASTVCFLLYRRVFKCPVKFLLKLRKNQVKEPQPQQLLHTHRHSYAYVFREQNVP